MKGKGGFRGKGGKGGPKGRFPSADEKPTKDEAARVNGPVQLYPEHPKMPKPQPLTDVQKNLVGYYREMEARCQKSNPWAEDNILHRLGVARWSDRFRGKEASGGPLEMAVNEAFIPAALCRSTPPTRKRAPGSGHATPGSKLEALEKLEASGQKPEQEEPDAFSDDAEDDVDNEFDDDFEFDYEDDGEVGLGDADMDAEL